MRPDDDDLPEFEGGPPPDPSMRQWRHPSEIAAAASAAARPDPPSPDQRRRRTALVTTIGVGLVATVVVGLGATLVATMTIPSNGTDIESEGAERAPDAGESLGRSAGIRSTPLPTTATTAATTTSASTTTSIALSTTTEPALGLAPGIDVNGIYAGPPPVAPAVAPGDGTADDPTDGWGTTADGITDGATAAEEQEEPGNGGKDGDPTTTRWIPTSIPTTVAAPAPAVRLGDFVVVDDLILTSASLIRGHDDLHLVIDGQWVPVVVRGEDPLTDLALLGLGEGASPIDLGPHRLAWSVDGEAFAMPELGSAVYIGGYDEPSEGAIIGPKPRLLTPSGEPIYSAWLTSVERPDGSTGSAATDARGLLIGLVVNSPDYLASVVSVDTMLDVGHAMLEWGRPALEWLGVEGRTPEQGGVLVDGVELDSPGHRGGIRPGDRIVAVDGKPVVDREHLAHLARQAGVGAEIRVVVDRNGLRLQRTLTIGSLPPVNGDG
ncbi:MAG: PDZ domain-containing protein [Actinomycetota bacterium]